MRFPGLLPVQILRATHGRALWKARTFRAIPALQGTAVTDEIPDRWETGTQAHELIAGIGAAVEYIAGVGRHSAPTAKTRREALAAAYRTTVAYERRLIASLIEGLQTIPSVRIYGITDPQRFEERCSTLSLRIGEHSPRMIAEFLAAQGIFTWDGNYYALNLKQFSVKLSA